MSKIPPGLILIAALGASVFTIFGGDSFSNLKALRQSLSLQREKNQKLSSEVKSLEREIHGLKHDDRLLEKAARNELGLARPNELIFIFEGRTGATSSRGLKADQSTNDQE